MGYQKSLLYQQTFSDLHISFYGKAFRHGKSYPIRSPCSPEGPMANSRNWLPKLLIFKMPELMLEQLQQTDAFLYFHKTVTLMNVLKNNSYET